MTLFPGIVGTKSVGSLKLASADPTDAPLINPNLLGDPHDVAVTVEGIRIARRLLNSAAFDPYRGEEYLPGPAVQSDEEIGEDGSTATVFYINTSQIVIDNWRIQSHNRL